MTSHHCGLSFGLLIILIYIASCEQYYIIPSNDVECPVEVCLTLSEISSGVSTYTEGNKTIFTLHPGNHSLDKQLSISNISEFQMVSNESSTTSILCKSSARMEILDISIVLISGLKFIGCGDSSISRVDNVTIRNSTFERVDSGRTTLLLNQTAAATIQESYFLFNSPGNVRLVTDFVNFEQSQNVRFDSLNNGTRGGAIVISSSSVVMENSWFDGNEAEYGGAIFAELNSSIVISNSVFCHNWAVGNGGAIYASQSNLHLTNDCTFSHNGARTAGVIHLEGSNASMHQCDFNNNVGYDQAGVASIKENSTVEFVNCSFASNRAETLGSALYITASSVTIEQSDFVNNSVEGVGAVMTVLEHGHVNFSYTTISNNRANLAMMSIYNSIVEFNGHATFKDNVGSLVAFNSTVTFTGETIFSNCTTAEIVLKDVVIQEGGAISVYSSRLTFLGNTLFVHNSAKYGGALFAVESDITFMVEQDHLLHTFLQSNITIRNNTATITGGGVYLYHSTMYIIKGHCFVTSNDGAGKGGGIHAINSDIKLEPPDTDKNYSLVMAENRAQIGGGVYLEGASKLVVSLSNSTIRFSRNTAENGAAIYVDDTTKFDTCFTTPANITPASECFFNVIGFSRVLSNTRAVENIIVEQNNATYNGSSLFGGLLDRCTPHTLTASIGNTLLTGTIVEQSIDGLSYLQKVSNIKDPMSIASRPTRVCFCIDGEINCDVRSLSMQVRKGQSFMVEVVAIDQVESPLYARIFSYLSSTDSSLDRGRRFRIEAKCTNITYSIRSPLEYEEVSLFADGPCRDADPSRLTVGVTFSPCTCPIGFEHTINDDTDCVCECNSLISEHIEDCNITSESFVRKDSSWISHVTTNNQSTYIVCERCPFRYCQRPSSDEESIRINLNNDIGADIQCSLGHTGTICGICAPNYSVSLAHKKCLPCSENWYLTLIGVTVGTILAGLGVVIGILAINFTVAVGTINGFIFYANIVDVYDSTFLPLSTSSFPVLIIEWLNLDPGFDICFIKGIDLYWHTWVRLIFPAYIILIVIIIILVSERSLRFSKLIGKRNPIATLATLVFLSFTNVLETAVVSLRPTTLTYISSDGSYDETVWLPDGDIKYFKGKHIPLFLVAVLLVLFTFIYMILITTWQWVVRFPKVWMLKWTKNQKLKSFMEAYYAPYSDKHRYWTGVLLFIRVLLILISISSEGRGPTIPLSSIIFLLGVLFVLKMTYAKNLYKSWPIDALETAMIFNLYVYAVYTWFALDDLSTRKILAHVSTAITFVALLLAIAYHIYAYILVNVFPKLQGRMSRVSLSMLEQHRPSNSSLNNLDNRDDVNEGEDRFHDMLGTVTMRRNQSVRSQVIRPEVHRLSPTFTVLETPYNIIHTTAQDQEQETPCISTATKKHERETSVSDIQSSSDSATSY